MDSQNLKYLTVCLKELTNHKIQFFFDANDFISAIQGIQRFYESPSGTEFQKEIFDNENSVVHSLLTSGLLGESIKLLPPHQAELSDKLKNGTLFKKVNRELLNQFLTADLAITDIFNDIKTIESEEKSSELLSSWVNQKGKDIFKAIHTSIKLSYNERLVELYDNNILQVENYGLSDIEIDDQELFNSLSDAFNTDPKRGKEDRSENNFRDVIALMFLARKVKAFNNDTKKPVPIFFDSQNFLKLIPNNLKRKYFTLKYSGTEILALRTHNYFKIYSLLKFNYSFPNKDKPYQEFIEHESIIRNIINDLNQLETVESILGTQAHLEKGKDELDKKITEYFNYDFFNSILLKTFIDKKEILEKISTSIKGREFDFASFEVLKLKVEAILNKFNTEINELVYSSAFVYKEIESRFEFVKKLNIQLKKEQKALNIFHDYSLFRFFIPEKYANDLNVLFSEDGVLSNDPVTARAYLTLIWNLYYRTINNKKGDLEEYELFNLYTTFWILNLHELVVKFKFSITKLHHSLLMLKGACLNRAIRELDAKGKESEIHIEAIKHIVHTLNKRLELINRENNVFGEINIVISYLYFLLWLLEGNKLILEGGSEVQEKNDQNYNRKAIHLAKEAYTYFNIKTAENNPYRVYALNIYVYFITDTSTVEEFLAIKNYRQEFIRLRGKIKDWHFRYDDTIARNFHRLALLQDTNAEKLEVLQNAIDILKETTENHKILQSRDINEVRSYFRILNDLKAELNIKKNFKQNST